jgi:hypothetical protein
MIITKARYNRLKVDEVLDDGIADIFPDFSSPSSRVPEEENSIFS